VCLSFEKRRKILKKIVKTVSFALVPMFFVGCTSSIGTNKVNPTSYTNKINKKAQVPKVCKSMYKSSMPKVGVVDFINNSTFDKATIDSINSNKKVGIGFSGLFVGAGSKSERLRIKRNIDSKLSKSVTSLVESMVLSTGGAELFTRTDMNKVDKELKLQDSGMLDSDTLVEFGRTSGVKYLVTGTIDNVEQDYTDYSDAGDVVGESTKNSKDKDVKLLGALVNLATKITGGMSISTDITLRIIDVQTGKIEYSKKSSNSKNIGKIKKPSYDAVIGAVKSNIAKSIDELKPELTKYFGVKGYITQIRKNGSNTIAQINIGSEYKVKPNQLFDVYTFEESIDPLTDKLSCDLIKTDMQLKATNQITKSKTWTTVNSGNPNNLMLLQLVQKRGDKDEFDFSKIPSF
jgi:curli biogenesis system outer membrane secretion channel CsgG